MPDKKKKRNQHSRLSEEKKEELFRTFLEKQSNSYVARKCKVSVTTVKRHREWDRWDERRDITLKAVEKKMVISTAESIVKNLKIVRRIRDAVVIKLAEMLQDGTYKATVWDLDKLIEREGKLLSVAPAGDEESGLERLARLLGPDKFEALIGELRKAAGEN